ncbi:MAG TPA: PAS domain S-box protein [Methanomicrobia archaeon]|nr:PAS domain S-box protein [Methanomicrobia archaeon]
MRRQACKAGCDPLVFETVPTVRKAFERCDDRAYGCVVCDYQLPDGNGLDFLERYRSQHAHRPVIFLTGQGDESVARMAFKMGANDYFTKDDGFAVYERIYNAICTQIHHFEEGRVRRETERKLRSEQEWARTYFRLADVLMIGYDAAGTITHVNEAGQHILGYSHEELSGVPFVCELQPPYEREEVKDVLERLRTSPPGTIITNENDMVTKDGTRRTFFWRNSAIFDEKGRIAGFLASGMDITEHARQEMRIRHLNRLLDAIRSVNQLIVREQDASTLLQRVCDIVVTSHGYADIHIVLFKEDGSCRAFSPSSPGSDTPDIRKSLETGTVPPCMKRAMDQAGTVVVCRPDDTCRTCAIGTTRPRLRSPTGFHTLDATMALSSSGSPPIARDAPKTLNSSMRWLTTSPSPSIHLSSRTQKNMPRNSCARAERITGPSWRRAR